MFSFDGLGQTAKGVFIITVGALQRAKHDKLDAALFSIYVHSSMYFLSNCYTLLYSYHWVVVCLALMDFANQQKVCSS
jgi:hypothetical protein